MSTDCKEEVIGLGVEDDREITLISSDGERFAINTVFTNISTFITTALECDQTQKELDIPNVSGYTLKYIIAYMNYHKGVEPQPIQQPLRHVDFKDCCADPWDAEFITEVMNISRQDLYDLIMAANYMCIKSLLYLGCAKIASIIKGQPLQDVPTILSTKNSTKE